MDRFGKHGELLSRFPCALNKVNRVRLTGKQEYLAARAGFFKLDCKLYAREFGHDYVCD